MYKQSTCNFSFVYIFYIFINYIHKIYASTTYRIINSMCLFLAHGIFSCIISYYNDVSKMLHVYMSIYVCRCLVCDKELCWRDHKS